MLSALCLTLPGCLLHRSARITGKNSGFNHMQLINIATLENFQDQTQDQFFGLYFY
jgi:hypothetical protein